MQELFIIYFLNVCALLTNQVTGVGGRLEAGRQALLPCPPCNAHWVTLMDPQTLLPDICWLWQASPAIILSECESGAILHWNKPKILNAENELMPAKKCPYVVKLEPTSGGERVWGWSLGRWPKWPGSKGGKRINGENRGRRWGGSKDGSVVRNEPFYLFYLARYSMKVLSINRWGCIPGGASPQSPCNTKSRGSLWASLSVHLLPILRTYWQDLPSHNLCLLHSGLFLKKTTSWARSASG